MRTIADIYNEYKIMPNLQLHMLRVAGVAKQLCDAMSVPVDTDRVVKACLLHDMGNIVKFDLTRFPETLEPHGHEHWVSVQNEFKHKYGVDDHHANLGIARELGVNTSILSCIDAIGFEYWRRTKMEGSLEEKICAYADTRVAPFGVVSVEDRLIDGAERYKGQDVHLLDQRDELYACMYAIEDELFPSATITPTAITEDSIRPYLEVLKNYSITD